jgi:single-strand DNA-binding protein
MNYVSLLGRLTKDPDCRYTQTGKCVVQLTLAVDRPFSGQDGKKEADFIPCVLWGKTAEVVANYVHKGQRLLVEGRIQVRSYDAKDGSKRYATEVIGNSVEFIEKKEQSGGGGFEDMGQPVPYDEELPF